MIQATLNRVLDGHDLTRDEACETMSSIMRGETTPAQIAGFLVALRAKGETADEIAGCADAMRAQVLAVHPRRDDLVDTAGTGGDGAQTLNISTAAALVGPVHIENNYIHDLVLAPSTAFFCFKLGASQGANTPEIDYTGNTCISPGAGGFEQTNPGLNFKIVATHNCIQDGLYVIDFNELPGPGTSFDYNTLFTTDSSGRFAKWGGVRYDLAGLRGLGQELHGVAAQVCPTTNPTPTPTLLPTPTSDASPLTPTPTPTPVPSLTASPKPTSLPPTLMHTPSPTPTPTPTPVPSWTESPKPTSLTPTLTHTLSPTPTPTPKPVSSWTASPTPTSLTPTRTHTPPPTPTPTPTPTPSLTASPTLRPSTATHTLAPSPTPTPTKTPKPTPIGPTHTPSSTEEATSRATSAPSVTFAPVRGDADCNGRINIQDVILLLETLGQMAHRLPGGCIPDLDVNCDGKVDRVDALALLLVLSGEPTNLASGCHSPSA